MTASTLLFAALAVAGTILAVVMGFTIYEFQQMRRHPERFPHDFKHLHPEE